MSNLKIATYNIHKGFSAFNRRVVLHGLRERLNEMDADIVFLQEVQGEHTRHEVREDYPNGGQHDFLAEGGEWQHRAYGKNSVYKQGHHGNAILSRFPIKQWRNRDVSAHRFESRGLLHCEIERDDDTVHCLCTHFGLFERGRQQQLNTLMSHIKNEIPEHAPIIVAGDFNDWRNKLSQTLADELGMQEVFQTQSGKPAKSFPAALPMMSLDRIYVRGFQIAASQVHSGRLMSDHAALSAQLKRDEI